MVREIVVHVVVETGDEAEPITERAGDQAGAGRRSDQGELRQVEPDRAGRRPLAQHDVDLEVLHGGIEDLFDGAGQPVDLVDEQHVALLQLGEDGGEVTGPLEGRARGDDHRHVELVGDDAGEAGLAQPGRTGEQQVVGGLAAAAGRLQHDRQVLFELGLTHELGEGARSQTVVVVEDLVVGLRLLGPR